MIYFLMDYTGYSWKSFVYSIKLAIVGINFFFNFFLLRRLIVLTDEQLVTLGIESFGHRIELMVNVCFISS